MDNKKVKMLEKEITPYVSRATKVTIFSKEDMVKATDMLSVINRYADEVKKNKETVTKPMLLAIKAARNLFSPLEEKLELATSSLRSAMSSFQTEQKRLADIEAEKIAKRVEKGTLKVDTAIAKLQVIDRPDEKINTNNGSVSFVTVRKFEVMDKSKLPIEYLVPDEVKIRLAMKNGIELPGVRYFEEESVRNSR